jgi:hypothetical protein
MQLPMLQRNEQEVTEITEISDIAPSLCYLKGVLRRTAHVGYPVHIPIAANGDSLHLADFYITGSRQALPSIMPSARPTERAMQARRRDQRSIESRATPFHPGTP